ncbi:uncharacterized protein ISCGN_010505 [Ixodes scapularis]
MFALNAVARNYVVVEQLATQPELLLMPEQRQVITKLTLHLLANEEPSDFDACENGHTSESVLKDILCHACARPLAGSSLYWSKGSGSDAPNTVRFQCVASHWIRLVTPRIARIGTVHKKTLADPEALQDLLSCSSVPPRGRGQDKGKTLADPEALQDLLSCSSVPPRGRGQDKGDRCVGNLGPQSVSPRLPLRPSSVVISTARVPRATSHANGAPPLIKGHRSMCAGAVGIAARAIVAMKCLRVVEPVCSVLSRDE